MQPSKPCYAAGESRVVSPAERMRGFIRCPDCGKEISVGINAKTRIIPKHNKADK
jgi:phage terminase large subunit GpA-like protein